jgi:hypothetical protein
MHHRVPLEVEARGAPAVEHGDERGVADAEQRLLQHDGVADPQGARLRFSYRHLEGVVRHGGS